MQIFALSLIGGLLVLDTTAALQILISQPLISCTFLGWLGGDIQLGLHFGLLVQLLWLSQLPVGAAKIPAGNLGSIVGVILSLQLKSLFPDYPNIIILAAVLSALLFAYLGSLLHARINTWNTCFFNSALKTLDQGRAGALGLINILALLFRFVLASMLILAGVLFSVFVFEKTAAIVPASWDAKARFVEMAVIGGGAGFALNLYRGRKKMITLVGAVIIGISLFFII